MKQDKNINNHAWHNMLAPFPVFPSGKCSHENGNILIAIEEYHIDCETHEDDWVVTNYYAGSFNDPFIHPEYSRDGYFTIDYFGENIDFEISDCTDFKEIEDAPKENKKEEFYLRVIGWKYVEPFEYPGMKEFRKALEEDNNAETE